MRTQTLPPRHAILYVGVDVHKDTHTAVAINAFGEKLFEKVIGNSKEDFGTLVAMAHQVSLTHSLSPVFGLEDSWGNGTRLARYISSHHIMVKMVPPVLTDVFRKYETHPEKNDSLDAFAAAKVLIQRIDTLPTYTITKQDELSKEIKELSLDREFLVKERTRIKNQLHRLLHKAYNGEYRKKFKDPFSVKALNFWKTHAIPADTSDIPGDAVILKNQIKRKVKRLIDIREETEELEGELETLMEKTGQKLTTMNGCGIVLASKVMAEIREVKRFHSPSALAKYAGLCPRERSSGNTFRHVKTKSGNRRLNMAMHRIALSQISRTGNQEARTYFQRKVSEGKTKGQALCCLKRRLIDIIYMMLKYQQPYKYNV